MKRIFATGKTTFLEGVRGKIFYNLLLFAALLAVSSIILSMMSIGDKAKIIKDVGLTSISVFGLMIIVILGTLTMHNDLDKGIIRHMVSKPLSKYNYILGKFFGILGLILINTSIISIVITIIIWAYKGELSFVLYHSIVLLFIELIVLSAIVILFSTFLNPNIVILSIIATYIIGHSTSEARALVMKRGMPIIRSIFTLFYYLLPNFDHFNITIQAVHNIRVSFSYLLFSILYGISYTGIILLFAGLIMKRRDL